MISLKSHNLLKLYNSTLVWSNISFEHSKGILGISGFNGSGKSTLLKCLAQLEPLNKGDIIWYKNDVKLSKQDAKTRMSFMAPYINLYEELSVIENLEFIQKLRTKSSLSVDVLELIQNVQMKEYKDRAFGSLSTGQQQRVKIASLLATDSDILFLDEPGSNLDEEGYKMMFELISTQKELGKLVIIASNEQKEIDFCDQVIHLNKLKD